MVSAVSDHVPVDATPLPSPVRKGYRARMYARKFLLGYIGGFAFMAFYLLP